MGYSPRDGKESDTTEQLTHTHMHACTHTCTHTHMDIGDCMRRARASQDLEVERERVPGPSQGGRARTDTAAPATARQRLGAPAQLKGCTSHQLAGEVGSALFLVNGSMPSNPQATNTCDPRLSAKSLQSCLTLCNPKDRSPPGSSVHDILQARRLEWVALLFSWVSS